MGLTIVHELKIVIFVTELAVQQCRQEGDAVSAGTSRRTLQL
jgi:hypothetical protein